MDNTEFDLAAVVNKLMSDPAALEIVKNLKNGGTAEIPAGSDSTDAKNNENKTASDGTASVGLSPEMIAKLPEMMSALSPIIKSAENKGGETSADAEKRNKLLAALKPYLSDGRRSMIDTIMSLSKITNLIDLLPKDKS